MTVWSSFCLVVAPNRSRISCRPVFVPGRQECVRSNNTIVAKAQVGGGPFVVALIMHGDAEIAVWRHKIRPARRFLNRVSQVRFLPGARNRVLLRVTLDVPASPAYRDNDRIAPSGPEAFEMLRAR